MSPKISVIVPVYNVEKYLDRCMDSLLNQTLREIEIILVDDGSPDASPQMCDAYAQRDSRVRVVHKENAGLGCARNSGLDVARGEYIAFVDSDDYVDTEMYTKLYSCAREEHADAVFCNFSIVDRELRVRPHCEVAQKSVLEGTSREQLLLDMIASAPGVSVERKHHMSVWHSLYSAEIIRASRLRFPSEREVVSEDIVFQAGFIPRTRKIVFIPDTLYYYCYNESSLTKTFLPRKFDRYITLYRLLLDMTASVPGSAERCSRLFIGYVRQHIRQLTGSSLPRAEKREHLQAVVGNPVWKEISRTYCPSCLPPYPRVVYRLILGRDVRILSGLFFVINRLKK